MHRMITAHPLTHEELAILGLRARDTTPTPVPVPTGVPEIETDTATIRELGFRFRETGAHTFARPEHVAMIEFRWHLRETRPEHIAELTNIETFSSGPLTCSKVLRTFELGVLLAFPSGKRKTPKLSGYAG
jgi:hypothetical protein